MKDKIALSQRQINYTNRIVSSQCTKYYHNVALRMHDVSTENVVSKEKTAFQAISMVSLTIEIQLCILIAEFFRDGEANAES